MGQVAICVNVPPEVDPAAVAREIRTALEWSKASRFETPILRYFAIDHLPAGPLRQTSALFTDLAVTLDETLPDGAEKSTALRKLLEAKDAAVRAALDLQ